MYLKNKFGESVKNSAGAQILKWGLMLAAAVFVCDVMTNNLSSHSLPSALSISVMASENVVTFPEDGIRARPQALERAHERGQTAHIILNSGQVVVVPPTHTWCPTNPTVATPRQQSSTQNTTPRPTTSPSTSVTTPSPAPTHAPIPTVPSGRATLEPQKSGQTQMVPLSMHPQYGAEFRTSEQTDGTMMRELTAFLNANRTRARRIAGPRVSGVPAMSPEVKEFSDELIEVMRNAALNDPGFVGPLGLTTDGVNAFYDSLRGTMPTNSINGRFHVGSRTIQFGVDGSDQVAIALLKYEEGRALGLGSAWAVLWTGHAEANISAFVNNGVHYDPILERAVVEYVGGIGFGFQAVSKGVSAVTKLMDDNISNINPSFEFNYDDFQMLRQITITLAQNGSTEQGIRVRDAVNRGVGNNAISNVRTALRNALNPNLTDAQRAQHGQTASRLVIQLAQIGRDLKLAPEEILFAGHPMVNYHNPTSSVSSGMPTDLTRPPLAQQVAGVSFEPSPPRQPSQQNAGQHGYIPFAPNITISASAQGYDFCKLY
jgi:hypothetical protein